MREIDNYLMHYGVKGMKWGQRKAPEETGGESPVKYHKHYQNKDGSLNRRGVKKYGSYQQMMERYRAQGEEINEQLDISETLVKATTEYKNKDPQAKAALAEIKYQREVTNAAMDAISEKKMKEIVAEDGAMKAYKRKANIALGVMGGLAVAGVAALAYFD